MANTSADTGPTPGAPAVTDAPGSCSHPGCDRGGATVTAVRADGAKLWLCRPHQIERRRAASRRRQCPVCRSRFDAQAAGNGRPATYCTTACKSARERALSTAAVELAKDVQPEPGSPKFAETLDRCRLLTTTWYRQHRREGGPLRPHFEDMATKFWPDGVPPSTAGPPSAAAVGGAFRRLETLEYAAEQQRAEERKAAREEDHRADAAAQRGAAAERREADRRWRKELLGGAPVVEGEVVP